MLDATSPFEAQSAREDKTRVDGRAEIRFAQKGGQTRLARLYQHEPLRVLFPAPASGDIPQAALVTTSGGLVGGDRLRITIEAEAGAAAMAIAQAAEKVYRSAGEDCVIDVNLHADDGAWLEYLPQETILFDGARMNRKTNIHVHPEARLLAGEILVFGRIGRGERMHSGFVRDAWQVSIGGRMVWADALGLDGDIGANIEHPAGLGGSPSMATAVYAGPDAADNLEYGRDYFAENADGVIGGASLVSGVLTARWIGENPLALRHSFANYWAGLRARIMGYPAKLPRLWDV
ncbi:MAG: urease accessory protein UreD [Rhodospirillales bacterium]|jgi:urease accessory protein